jgi:long-chain fatty acid transport protein
MRSPLRIETVALLLALLAVAAPAGAQSVPEQDDLDFQGRSSLVLGAGARAMGMAGAFLARADDATAASWNPAGLSYLRQPEFTLVASRNRFETVTDRSDGARTYEDRFRGTAPDFAAATFPIEVGRASGAVQLSYQRTFAFFTGERDVVQLDTPPRRLSGDGGFDVLSVGSGLQVLRNLRIGVTVNRWVNGFDQERERLIRRRSLQRAEFGFTGWNFNVGLLWSPVPSLNVGVVGKTPFRGRVTLARRRTDFTSTAPDFPDIESSNFARSPGGSLPGVELEFPGAVGAGLSWRPSSPLTLSVDYTRAFWSDGRVRNYFTLPQSGAPEVFASLPFPQLYAEQVDTEQFRVGAEYVFLVGRVRLPVRAGYLSDRQFFRDDTGKAPRFDGFAVGAGVAIGNVLVDAAWLQESDTYPSGPGQSTKPRLDRLFVSLIYRR